ncbi:MAG: dephospho-CoA kinase [Candidatus Krumholzibacteriia bacterium]
MKIIGLAGESGTGKSTIAEHLRGRGASHIDADRVGHDLLENDPDVRRRLRATIGERVFEGDAIDRAALSSFVFREAAALATLNSIIHPAIVRECERRIEELARQGADMAVIDAALLLEVTLPFRVDLMIALSCSRDEQLRRLQAKGGFSREQLEARLSSQADLQKSFYRADVVLDTDRPKAVVLSEVERLIDFLLDTKR